MVEVEDFSSEDAFPLSGGDAGGGVPSGSDEVFAAGNVLAVDVEFLKGTLTTKREGSVGRVLVRFCPSKVGCGELPFLTLRFLTFF